MIRSSRIGASYLAARGYSLRMNWREARIEDFSPRFALGG